MASLFAKFKKLKLPTQKRLVVCWLMIVVIGVTFITAAVIDLRSDGRQKEETWNTLMNHAALTEEQAALREGATVVTTGIYTENIKAVNLKTNSFDVSLTVWFKWTGDEALDMKNNYRFYNGRVTTQQVVKELHNGNEHYQLLRVDATINTKYHTKNFPLERLQLRMYIESDYPIETVWLEADQEYSGLNPGMSLTGYEIHRSGIAEYVHTYPNTRNDPEELIPVTTSEIVNVLEVKRDGFGLYAKCFIALFGTTTWVLITLFINTYHMVDPLSMIPAALFGTVSNIMVGANLLPDTLDMGLLEYVNILGILTILAVAFSIININQMRRKNEDAEAASSFGRLLFFTILTLVIVGHVLMPLTCISTM